MISIVIPVRNRRAHTQHILTQLQQQIASLPPSFAAADSALQIVVVDDGSTDGTAELIEAQFPQVQMLRGDGSLWWTGAIAQGMQHARDTVNPAYFVWLNDDISLAPNFVAALIEQCCSDRSATAIVGGIVRDATYPEWIVYGGVKRGKPISRVQAFDQPEIEVDFLCGNVVIVPRCVVEAIGLPNATRLPHHGGDYDYVMRAKQAGFKALLTCQLQATTQFEVVDFIRYMPYWMQWYLQPSLAHKWRVVRGLTSLKANQNIWLMVNLHSSNRHRTHPAPWRYGLCYCNKLLRLLAIALVPRQRLDARVREYLAAQNPPAPVIEALLQQQAPKTHPSIPQCR